MLSLPILAAVSGLASLSGVAAHGGVLSYKIGNTWYPGWQPYNSPSNQVPTIQRPWSTLYVPPFRLAFLLFSYCLHHPSTCDNPAAPLLKTLQTLRSLARTTGMRALSSSRPPSLRVALSPHTGTSGSTTLVLRCVSPASFRRDVLTASADHVSREVPKQRMHWLQLAQCTMGKYLCFLSRRRF